MWLGYADFCWEGKNKGLRGSEKVMKCLLKKERGEKARFEGWEGETEMAIEKKKQVGKGLGLGFKLVYIFRVK